MLQANYKILIYIYNPRRKFKGYEYPICVFNVDGCRRIINLGFKIHKHSTYRAKKN